MNTANWIPDLFMKRVMENGEWTLFSPLGRARAARSSSAARSKKRTQRYEEKAARGRAEAVQEDSGDCSCGARCCRCCSRPGIRGSRSRIRATCAARSSTWAWFTAPTCAPRSRSTPIDDEIAVCNLGSVNMVAHMNVGGGRPGLDHEKLKKTISHRDAHARQRHRHQLLRGERRRAIRTCRHRPVGLGIMGFQDCLHLLRVPYASPEAVEFADRSMEAVAYCAVLGLDRARRGARPLRCPTRARSGIAASCRRTRCDLLARERGRLRRDRHRSVDARLGSAARAHPAATACATPTASRSRRRRPSPTSSAFRRRSSRPIQNLFVKSNLSGEFTVVNEYLVADLEDGSGCGTRS